MRPSKGGAEDYVRITLQDVLCTSLDMGGTQDSPSMESASLSFSTIMIETLAKGSSEWQKAGWDLAKNVKI